MKNNINWLLMLVTERNNGLYSVTVKQDGYVVDNKQKKLFVLKKATMGKLRKLVNEYEPLHLTDRFDSKCLVKCNNDTDGGFVTNDKDFYSMIIKTVYQENNIKHPPEMLDSVISLIEELRATGELDNMIQAEDLDAVTNRILSMCE